MKRLYVVLGLLLLILASREAASQGVAKTWILQNAATAASTGTVAHVAGYTVATVQIVVPTGASPTATVAFQQSMNDIHYTAIRCLPTDGTSAATSVSFTPANIGSAALQWRCNISGAYWFRANITVLTGPGSVSVFGIMTSGDPQVSATGGFLIDSTSFPFPVVQSPQQGAWPVLSHVQSVGNAYAGASRFAVSAHVVTDVSRVAVSAHIVTDVSRVAVAAHVVTDVSPVAVNAHVQSVGNIYAGASPLAVRAHQGGEWNVAHVGSVTHVNVTRNNAGTATSVASVAASATNVTCLASNTQRISATLVNDSQSHAYVKLGATASLTSYTAKLFQDSSYTVDFYTGIIDCIWESAIGNMRTTVVTP